MNNRQEEVIEAILIGICKLAIFVVYPAIYYVFTKDDNKIYPVSE